MALAEEQRDVDVAVREQQRCGQNGEDGGEDEEVVERQARDRRLRAREVRHLEDREETLKERRVR